MNRNNSNLQKKSFPSKMFANVAMVGLALCGISLSAKAAPNVPFIVSAYSAVEKSPEKAGVSATITMTTLGSPSTGPKVLVAQGPLMMEGDLLGGRLPMSFDKSDSLPTGEHTLFFNISKTGRIGLQWLINDKPRDGKPMQAFDTDVSGTTLTKKLTWQGEYRLVTVSIERKLSMIGRPILTPGGIKGGIRFRPTPKPPLKPVYRPGRIIVLKPTPTPKPIAIIVAPAKKKPIGRKVKVTGRFVVTNSDDGVGGIFGNSDKRVEMSGYIGFGNQTAFNFSDRKADDGDEFQSKAMNSVVLNYSDPNHRFFSIKGSVRDYDTASAADTMWVSSQNVDLISIMQSNKEYLVKGDRNSESGDLYIRVIDEGEVY